MPHLGFDQWLATPQGKYVLAWEQAKLDQIVADIFGFNAVQIGLPQCDFLQANRMPLRLFCDDRVNEKSVKVVNVVTDFHDLPFAANSIDLVVLPHVLEFSNTPQQVLREVERVLVPEGHLIITGFNPVSLWGLKRRWSNNGTDFPWRGQYLGVHRLKDWLTLLGFETQAGSFGCYVPVVTQEKWLRRWKFMELAGNRWWPIAGATYMLQSIKRQHGMRLLTPAWQDRKARAKALAPAVRQVSEISKTRKIEGQ